MGGVGLTLFATLQATVAWIEVPTPAALANAEVRSVAVAPDGAVWLAVRDRGVAYLDGSDIRWFSESDGLMSNGVADLMIDPSAQVWASGVGGYSVRRGDGWSHRSTVGSLRPRVIYSLSQDPRTGAIWMAANVGAGRLLDGRWTVFDSTIGLPHAVVHAVHSDATGAIWFACRTGLGRMRDGVLDVMFPSTNFRSILEGPDGRLWFGTTDGVMSWDGESWAHALRGRTVYPRLVSRDGAMWAGSASAGVFRHVDGDWIPVQLPARFGDAEVFDLDEGGDGSIWIATSVGVLRLRSES